MTLKAFAFATFCFLTGVVSSYVGTRLVQDSSVVSVSMTTDQAVYSGLHAPVIGGAPSSVEADQGGVSATQGEGRITALSPVTADDKNDEIDYGRLFDYRNLLNTLTKISSARKSQLWMWIDTAPALSDVPSITRSVHQAMFQRLAVLEPKAVVGWILQRANQDANNHQSDILLEDAIVGFSQAQPKAAEKWLLVRSQQQVITIGLLKAIGRFDPEGMLAQAANYTDQDSIDIMVSEWAQRDLSAAYFWLVNRATGDEKAMYESTIVDELIRRDTDAALAYLAQSSERGENRWAVSQYGSVLAQSDPQAALNWALEHEDMDLVEQAMLEVVWNWPHNELAALQAHIESIDDAVLRERITVAAAYRILDQFAQDDSMSAMAWVDTLSPSVQAEIRPQVMARWSQNEPSNALGLSQ